MSEHPPVAPATLSDKVPVRTRVRFGLVLTFLGFLIFLLGARPELFGLDRSPVVGFVQIAVFLIGLAIICVGGFICLMVYWKNGDRTIAADIGSRLVATGYVIVVFSGMADVFGFGTQPLPEVSFFGPWQSIGVQIGEVVIGVGFLLLIPFKRKKVSE